MKLKFKLTLALSIIASSYVLGAESVSLSEVTVSANKMEENIKDIPQSISVIDENALEEKRIRNIAAVAREIPNMNFSTFIRNTRINFRGINHSEFTNSNPVVIYIDGVPHSSVYGNYNALLTNAERVEVLRGPQGALYGKDSIGGVINVITKAPKNEWGGNFTAEYGSHKYMMSGLDANGALIDDKLFMSFGAIGQRDDGWITNAYNKDDRANKNSSYKFNATLTAKPTDRLTARLTLSADRAKDGFFQGGIGILGKLKRDDAKTANYEVPTTMDSKSFAQSLGVEYEFDKVKFTSITAHKNSHADGKYDADFVFKNSPNEDGLEQWQDVEIDTLSQEFRLNSVNEGKFKWIAGIYLEKEETENKKMGQEFYDGAQKNGQNAPAKFESDTVALFGQASYDVVDALTLTLGGRYQQIKKDVDLRMRYYVPIPAWGMSNYDLKDGARWNKFLPKFGVLYRLNDDISLFANYSTGYLAGGYNYFASRDNAGNKFNPQTSHNYELGIHGNAFDNRLRLSATLFYMDIKDVHTYQILPPNSYITKNGGDAVSKGFEIEALYRVSSEIDISGSFGLSKTKLKNHKVLDRTIMQDVDVSGNKIQNTPAYTAALGISYTHPSGIYTRADLKSNGSLYFDEQNRQKQGSWITADVRLGYRFKDFDVYGYVTNLTNEEYVESYLFNGRYGMVHFNDPRKFGVGFRYSF